MASIIDRNTKNLMSAKLQKELADLFAEQEASRRPRYNNTMPLRAPYGIDVPPDGPEDPWNAMLNPNGMYPAQNMNGVTQTPENAFNLRDKIQVYGNQALGKIGDLIPAAVATAPVWSNIIGGMGKSQRLNPQDFYNPNRNKVASLMANRRVNVQPQLDEILNSEKMGQYNLRNTAGSRGELMGNLTGINNAAMRNKASVLAQAQNANLGYQGQEAEMLNQLGAGEQQANWNVMDYNNQNIANKRNMWRAGLSQLSQYGQNKELQKNQMTQDQNKLAALKDMFAAIAPFMKSLQGMQFSNIQ